MDDLIYDRTQQDVEYALNNQSSNSYLKGAYNFTDLNRIETWCGYIAEQLNLYNYYVSITTKTDWKIKDFPTKVEMKRIRDNVNVLKNALVSAISVPDNLEKMTYQKANQLEKALFDLNTYINSMIQSFYHSSEIYSGEV